MFQVVFCAPTRGHKKEMSNTVNAKDVFDLYDADGTGTIPIDMFPLAFRACGNRPLFLHNSLS